MRKKICYAFILTTLLSLNLSAAIRVFILGKPSTFKHTVDFEKSYGKKVIHTKGNNIVLSGILERIAGTREKQKVFIAQYSIYGNYKWKSVLKERDNRTYFLKSMISDKNGNIFIAGNFSSPDGTAYSGGYIAKFSSQGVFRWMKELIGHNMVDIATDSNQLFVLSNRIGDSTAGLFVRSFTVAGGAASWVKQENRIYPKDLLLSAKTLYFSGYRHSTRKMFSRKIDRAGRNLEALNQVASVGNGTNYIYGKLHIYRRQLYIVLLTEFGNSNSIVIYIKKAKGRNNRYLAAALLQGHTVLWNKMEEYFDSKLLPVFNKFYAFYYYNNKSYLIQFKSNTIGFQNSVIKEVSTNASLKYFGFDFYSYAKRTRNRVIITPYVFFTGEQNGKALIEVKKLSDIF